MKNRLVSLLLILTMLTTILSSCNNTHIPTPDGVCEDHVDLDGDGKCDECEADVPEKPEPEKPEPDAPTPGDPDDQLPSEGWEKTSLLFELSVDNTENLSSSAYSYLAGESSSGSSSKAGVKQRNEDAEKYANVDVSYVYYPGRAPAYIGVWGASINHISELATSSTAANRPDIFCNYEYDLFAASLLGAFANLYGDGAGSDGVDLVERGNYFSFVKDGTYDPGFVDTGRGYMIDYMRSLSLSESKMYIVASDYFIDTVRAMLVVPVNVHLLTQVKPSYLDPDAFNCDYDADGRYELSDFYELVKNKRWTYDALRGFSRDIEVGTGGFDQLDGTHGFALGTDGIGISALLYTSSVEIIKCENTSTGDYKYAYPGSCEALSELVAEISGMFSSRGFGVTFVQTSNYGLTPELAIRRRFNDGFVLFGGIDYFGSLEDMSYQDMYIEGYLSEYTGFGIAPIPLWDDAGDYTTAVYKAARSGAIAAKSSKFAQCSAFLDYQSTHSDEVIGAYIRNTVDKKDGNVEMAYSIRKSVGTALDRALDNEIVRRASYTPLVSKIHRWPYDVIRHEYNITYEQMMQYYSDITEIKKEFLDEINGDISELE